MILVYMFFCLDYGLKVTFFKDFTICCAFETIFQLTNYVSSYLKGAFWGKVPSLEELRFSCLGMLIYVSSFIQGFWFKEVPFLFIQVKTLVQTLRYKAHSNQIVQFIFRNFLKREYLITTWFNDHDLRGNSLWLMMFINKKV